MSGFKPLSPFIPRMSFFSILILVGIVAVVAFFAAVYSLTLS